MKVIEGEFPVYFDVDNTLITFLKNGDKVAEGDKFIVDPVTQDFLVVRPHVDHMRLLERMALRGHTIVVWSLSGAPWAEVVVKALGLEEFVTAVIGKPLIYVDDKDINEWIGRKVFIKEGWGS